MSRTRIVIVALVVLAAIPALLVFSSGRGAGPAYEGKRMPAWLARYCAASSRYSPAISTQESVDAFRALGTNATTYLVAAAVALDGDPMRAEVTTQLQRELRWLGMGNGVRQIGRVLFNTQPKPTLDADSLRAWSRQALADIPAKPADVLPLLQPKLVDPRAEVRLHAIRVLGTGIFPPEQIAPFLLSGLRDGDQRIRLEAVKASGGARLKHPEFTEELTRAFDQAASAERKRLVFALTTGNPQAPEALPLLLRLLADSGLEGRFAIAEAIWHVEPGHPQALKILLPEIRNGPNDRAAARLLAETTPPYRLPADFFDPAIFGPSTTRQSLLFSAEYLVAIGMPKAQAIAMLEQALQSQRGILRHGLAMALSRIDPGSPKAIAALIWVAQMPSLPSPYKIRVIMDLRSFGPAASNAVPVLIGLLPGASPGDTALINSAIQQIQSAPPKPNSPTAP